MRLEVERNLTAIAQLKADEIAAWRRINCMMPCVLQEDIFLRASVAHFLNDPSLEYRPGAPPAVSVSGHAA